MAVRTDERVQQTALVSVSGRVAPASATRLRDDAKTNVLFIAALVGIAVAAVFVRVWQINALGFNSDESVYAGQAAAIANNADLKPFFPIFRAHPLLFQTVLSLGYRMGGGDLTARLLAVATGLATVYLVFATARLLYGRKAGLAAALFIALMPYHVIVTRQVLLDGPMVMFATLSLYAVARYSMTGRATWLYVAGGAIGLTVISKETGALLLGSVYVFLALSSSIRVRARDIAISLFVMAIVVAPYPLAVLFSGKSSTGQNYLAWQLFRPPNHGLLFYPTNVPEAMGYLVIVAAIAGFWLHRRTSSWRETLLIAWVAVPVVFFELWPVKGFQYLLPAAPAVAILAGRAVGSWSPNAAFHVMGISLKAGGCAALAMLIITASLILPAWHGIQPSESDEFLAGSGGVPGGREAGLWVNENVPAGATMLALGPSMANIIQFYGHRKAYGLSVSPNPQHRNPSYEAVANPDRALRNNDIQYVVWDAFSASRSSFFSNSLLRYVARYHGTAVHQESVPARDADGSTIQKPVIIIYEVRP